VFPSRPRVEGEPSGIMRMFRRAKEVRGVTRNQRSCGRLRQWYDIKRIETNEFKVSSLAEEKQIKGPSHAKVLTEMRPDSKESELRLEL